MTILREVNFKKDQEISRFVTHADSFRFLYRFITHFLTAHMRSFSLKGRARVRSLEKTRLENAYVHVSLNLSPRFSKSSSRRI